MAKVTLGYLSKSHCDKVDILSEAIIDFIAGMTDRFAVKLFNELISY